MPLNVVLLCSGKICHGLALNLFLFNRLLTVSVISHVEDVKKLQEWVRLTDESQWHLLILANLTLTLDLHLGM